MENKKIDVLIPLAGKSVFFNDSDYLYPKPLIEVNAVPMIQLVLERLIAMDIVDNFIFVVDNGDCKRFHLDNVLKLLTKDKCEIVRLDNSTKGASCSSLMAIDYLNHDKELIICNGDQIINQDYNDIVDFFRKNNYDAGVVTFESVHPRWSYVRLNSDNHIIETAEKRPISNSAIAGFYYFKRAQLFIDSSMRMIEKDANVEGRYYIAPSLNELILVSKKLGVYPVSNDKYHSFYSPQKIKAYESK